MEGRQRETWAGMLPLRSARRRQVAQGLLVAAGVVIASRAGDATIAKKRKHKKKNKGTCPSGETRCPKGFPSACCAAGTDCCDTSRLGCCEIE